MPEGIWREVDELAKVAGTTPNDVLVRLVAERLRDRQRAFALQERADQRWAAFTGAPMAGEEATTGRLSEQELIELSGAFREDA